MKREWFGLVAAVCGMCVAGAGQRVKVIAHGWDVLAVSPKQVLEHADLLNELPIDGLFLNVNAGKKNGTLMNKKIAYDLRWDYNDFKYIVPTLREMKKHRSLRHSLLGALIANTWKYNDTASRKRWDDDAAWELFANNLGVLARIAREGDIEGILLDPEDYSGIRQFRWREGDGDYDTVRKLARQRGREVFSAAFREKPDLKLMSLWFMSWPFGGNYRTSDDPNAERYRAKDLWPDFVNGMLDVLPETAMVIDGDETTYYDRGDNADTFRKSKQVQNAYLRLVEPENRTKYRGKMYFAPASYLDSYVSTDEGSLFYQPAIKGGTRLDRFAENFEHTVVASDGYVWLYGERHPLIKWRDIPMKRVKDTVWDAAVPGMYDIVGASRDASDWGARKFRMLEKQGCKFVSLLKNGSCAISVKGSSGGFLTNRFASGFSTWKHGKTPGEMGTDTTVGRNDRFSVRLEKVKRGSVIATFKDIKLGDRFIVRVFGKGKKLRGSVDFCSGYPSYPIRFEEGRPDEWRAGYTYVVVPRNVKTMRVIMSGSADETVWYDDFAVYQDSAK